MVIDIFAAKKRVEGVAKWTPLVHSKTFSNWAKNNVYLKLESLQVAGSFKIRGAYNKIATLTKQQKKKGVIASSTGNHAQAVARAATMLGVKSTIVMPEFAPLAKVTATKRYGAKVILHGTVYDDAYEEAKRLQKKLGLTFVHPYNDEEVISGQGTIGLEIIKDLPNVDAVFVPIGGGGLISGISTAIKSIKPKVKIIGVQAEGAHSLSFEKGGYKLLKVKDINTIADGIAVKHPGSLTLNIIRKNVDKIVTVNDDEISAAILSMLERAKYLAEPAGAVPLAAILHHKVQMRRKNVVAVISGGNIDIKTLDSLLRKGLVKHGRLVELKMIIPDKPGEITKILDLITANRAGLVSVERGFLSKVGFIEISLTLETEGFDHVNELTKLLKKGGYKIED